MWTLKCRRLPPEPLVEIGGGPGHSRGVHAINGQILATGTVTSADLLGVAPRPGDQLCRTRFTPLPDRLLLPLKLVYVWLFPDEKGAN